MHGREHQQARAEAWLEVVEGTRATFSVARDEIRARVYDLAQHIARDELMLDARTAAQARVTAHEYAADRVLDQIEAEVASGADEPGAAETAAREVGALVERGDEQATFERDLWAYGRGRSVVSEPREARLLAVPITAADIAAATNDAERERLFDVAAAQGALRALRQRPYAATVREAAQLYVEGRTSFEFEPSWARAYAETELSEGNRAVLDAARRQLGHQVAQIHTGQDPVAPAGAVSEDLWRTWTWPRVDLTADAQLSDAVQTVSEARNSGSGAVRIDQVDALLDAAGRALTELEERRDGIVELWLERDRHAYADRHGIEAAEGADWEAIFRSNRGDRGAITPSVGEIDVDADQLQALLAGAQDRRASAANRPDDLSHLRDWLLRGWEQSREQQVEHPGLHRHNAVINSQAAGLPQPGGPSASLQAEPAQDPLTDLAGVFGDSMTAGDVGTRMTCTEADAIARALLAGGHRLAASRWLAGHARGDDDETDRHLGDGFDLDTYLDGLDPRHANTPAARGPGGQVEDWAAVADTVDERIAESPSWPRLNAALHTAAGNGWAVATELPMLAAASPLPDHDPAGELYYRLLNSGAAEISADSGAGVGEQPPRPAEQPSYASDALRPASPGI